MNESAELIYLLYTEDFASLINSEDFYTYFLKAIKSGKNQLSLSQRYTENQIDPKWVEAIEAAIIPLDTIIRNPRRFIEQIEEIVPIEQARKITQESIRHLAQHTNMIAKVDKDGFVTPNQILNIYKEESFDTYENRFIYTLLSNLQYFIDKRLRVMLDAKVQAVSKISMNSDFQIGKENLQYSMFLQSSAQVDRIEDEVDIHADTTKLDMITRVERIRKILYDFQDSPLIRELNGCVLVKPPIMRTNVILKNPDFKQAMALWQFIETYRDSGYSVQLIENNELPPDNYMEQLYSVLAMNYCLLKHHTKTREESDLSVPIKKEYKPTLIRKTIEEYVNDLSMDVDTVQKIFVDEVKRSAKKRLEEEEKIKKIIDRALLSERKRKEQLKEMRKALAEKEKQRKLKEAEQIKKEKEKKQIQEKRAQKKAKEKEKRKSLQKKAKKMLDESI